MTETPVQVHLKPELFEESERLRQRHSEKLRAYLEARQAGQGEIGEDEIGRLYAEERAARKAWEEHYSSHFGWKRLHEG